MRDWLIDDDVPSLPQKTLLNSKKKQLTQIHLPGVHSERMGECSGDLTDVSYDSKQGIIQFQQLNEHGDR